MNILGIGIPELIIIFIVAMIVLGPGNMVKTATQASAAIKKLLNSEMWRSMVNSTKEIRTIQGQIMKETGLPETIQSLKQSTRIITNPALEQWRSTVDTTKPAPNLRADFPDQTPPAASAPAEAETTPTEQKRAEDLKP
jgi:Sec-independent protein translocase protein TatA